MKFKSIFTIILILIVGLNRLVAQSFPAGCDAFLDVTTLWNEMNDTAITCVGTLVTLEDISALDGTQSTRDWVYGDGTDSLGALLSTQTSHFYNGEGIYTATLTVGSDVCPDITVSKTIRVIGNPEYTVVIDTIDCFGNCNGSLTIDILSMNSSWYTVEWDGGLAGMVAGGVAITGNTISELCAGNHAAVITDGFGCTTLPTIDINLPEPDQLLININQGYDLGLCPAMGVTDVSLFITGGEGVYQISWEASDFIAMNNGLTQFTPTSESLDMTYSIVVEDGNGCQASDSILISSLPSTLSGSVAVGSNPCMNCEVIQYQYSSAIESWYPVSTTTTDNFGNYDFGVIANFLPFTILANPDAASYPMAVPTFYPEGHLWNTATVFSDVCGQALTTNIDIPEPMNFNGSNIFDGTVYYSQSWKTETDEDPIPLIDVVVEKTPPGHAQGRQTTNNNGGYTFVLVPSSDTTYTIFVSIPGIPVNSTYEIMADQGNQTFYNLDFCLAPDSSAINTCSLDITVIDNEIESSEKTFTMYPNPNNGRFAIETGKFSSTESELRIVDTIGRIVFRKRYAETPSTINMVNMAEGYYLVQLINDYEFDSSPINVMRF
ncbi:MAG: T9SS type A sorting domain-containing protein [Flavobacteriales bacterium]|nr:T9SS type A sorting domain-containing protein [Flavobacteriales bacterium]